MWNMFAITSMYDSSALAGILYDAAAFPTLITTLNFSIVGVVIFIKMFVCAASISSEFSGAGVFMSSPDCFTHLSR